MKLHNIQTLSPEICTNKIYISAPNQMYLFQTSSQSSKLG